MNLYNELKSLIIKNGYTMKQVAEALNISSFAVLSKFKTGEFKVSELKKLISIIGKDEVMRIFFN